MFHERVSETLEDMALAEAIEEGMESETVSREDIFIILHPLEDSWNRKQGAPYEAEP